MIRVCELLRFGGISHRGGLRVPASARAYNELSQEARGSRGLRLQIRTREREECQLLALNQDQPVGNDRCYRDSEAMTDKRRELRKRGRPRKQDEQPSGSDAGQGQLPL